MNNKIIKKIISDVSFDEMSIIDDKLHKVNLDSSYKANLLTFQDELCKIYSRCLGHSISKREYRDFIYAVGIDNICRYFNSLCFHYARMQGDYEVENKYDEYLLDFNDEAKMHPLSSISDDSSYDLNTMLGVYSRPIPGYEVIVYNSFKDCATILKDAIDSLENFEAFSNKFDSDTVKASLNALVDRGLGAINYLIEDKYYNSKKNKIRSRNVS